MRPALSDDCPILRRLLDQARVGPDSASDITPLKVAARVRIPYGLFIKEAGLLCSEELWSNNEGARDNERRQLV